MCLNCILGGYRSFDLAQGYGQFEGEFGRFLSTRLTQDYGLERKDLFIISKGEHAISDSGMTCYFTIDVVRIAQWTQCKGRRGTTTDLSTGAFTAPRVIIEFFTRPTRLLDSP